MRRTRLSGLTTLLLPFGAYAAAAAYGGYLRKPRRTGGMASTPTAVQLPFERVARPPAVSGRLGMATGVRVTELVVVDAAVPQLDVLRRGLRRNAELVILESGADSLRQLTEILARYRDLEAVHIVSHGRDGEMILGGERLDAQTLEARPDLLAALNTATRAGADLLIYGCDVAATGTELLEIVRGATHLDVAASSDLTGSSEVGGDWDLEIAAGNIEAELPFSETALRDFTSVLQLTGTKTFESWNGEYYSDDPTRDWDGFTTYIDTPGSYVELLSGTVCGDDLYVSMYEPASKFLIRAIPAGGSFGIDALTIRAPNSGGNPATQVSIFGYADGNPTPVGSKPNVAVGATPTAIDLTAGITGSFTNIVRLRIQPNNLDFCLMSIDFPNAPPTDIALSSASINQSQGANAVVGLLSTVDANAGDVHTYTLVPGGGDTHNSSFNISGNELRANDAASLAAGSYNVRVQTDDGNGGIYAEAFAITVADDVPTQFLNGTPSVSGTTPVQTTLAVSLDEAGTAYYVVVADGAPVPSAVQVKAGQDGGGSATLSGSISVSTAGAVHTTNVTGLAPGTAYDIYVVAEDGVPNLQAAATRVDVTTGTFDADGNLTAAGGVLEPVALPTTADTTGEAVGVIDFTLSDGGAADGLPLNVSQIVVHVGGTSTHAERSQVTWRLNGPDAANVPGAYAAGSSTITFPALAVSVADGGNETYTINAFYNANTGLTDGHTITLELDGGTDLTLGSGTQMGATSPVGNGSGTAIDVLATSLVFTTQPSGSVSGQALTTQPAVAARDAFGNVDADFAETLTLTEASAGTLSGNTETAVNGIATFTSVAYTATADQQSFTLTANDQDGVGSNLPTAAANAVTSDVVATKLRFATQPAPLTVQSGAPTSFATAPVVEAVDDQDIVDTGYGTTVTLAAVNGAGSATLTATGDTDGSAATVSVAPTSGAATFANLEATYTAAGSGDETFNLRATSGALTSADSAQLTAAVNQLPGFDAGASASLDVNEDGAAASLVSLLAVTDADAGDTLVWSVAAQPARGTLGGFDATAPSTGASATPSGVTYTPNAGDAGADSFQIEVSDGSASDTITVNVAINARPTAALSSAETSPTNNSPIQVTVAFNEAVTGFDAGGLTVTNGSAGSVTGGPAVYTATITPAADGDVTIGVAAGAAQDSAGAPNHAATALIIEYDGTAPAAPSTPDLAPASDTGASDSDDVTSDATPTFTGTAEPAAAVRLESDVDGTLGTTTASGSGVWSLTTGVAVSAGRHQITAVAIDVAGNESAPSAALALTIDATPPTAADDSVTTNEDEAVEIAVLANDGSAIAQLNAASVTVVGAPSNGSTSVNTGTGVIVYTPASNFNGTDTFTYTVDDLSGGGALQATVTITVDPVNDAPAAAGDTATTAAGTPVLIDVAANDGDVDVGDAPDPATIAILRLPANGSAAVDAGQIRYTPNAGFTGTDEISYTIEDDHGAASNEAAVIVNVAGANVAPQAAGDAASTDEDQPVAIDVLANDADLDGTLDPASVRVLLAPQHGGVTVDTATGAVTYAPAPDFNGADAFTYVVGDDAGATSTAAAVTVNVASVNDAPTAVDDMAVVAGNAAHVVNVLGNDSDVDGTLDPTSVEIVTPPGAGTAAPQANGAILYTPGAGYAGVDELAYRVRDDAGAWSAPAILRVTNQSVNGVPLANDDSVQTLEDTAVTVAVLDNDSDVDGSLDTASVTIGSQPSRGSVRVLAGGSIEYTPDADTHGTDSFEYTVADDDGGVSAQATVHVDVEPVNDAPSIAGTPPQSVDIGQTYSFSPVLADVDGDALHVSAANLPGWLSLNPQTGVLSGSPGAADAGSYPGIVLTVDDGRSTASLPAFTLTVVGVVGNDADGDGMPDDYELVSGFDPLDPADAGGDADNDGTTNVDEFLAGSDPLADDYPPTLGTPAAIEIDAQGLLTPMPPLPVPSALDGRDGPVNVRLVGGVPYLEPGRHTLEWRAADAAGNEAAVTQTIDVDPLISLAPGQVRAEGGVATVRFLLNGPAPEYPLDVAYDIGGTASMQDHDLAAGIVTFVNGETEKAITVQLHADGLTEGEETLIVTLTGAGNFGPRSTHVVTIVEHNVAPIVTLSIEQDGREARHIAADRGPVGFQAQVDDANAQDAHTYAWYFPSGSIVTGNGALMLLDPALLAPGLHQVRLIAHDDGMAPLAGEAVEWFVLEPTFPALSPAADADGDGVSDAAEGHGDVDGDGQADYLDRPDSPNVLNAWVDDGSRFRIESDPGLRLALGPVARRHGSNGARVTLEELSGLGVPRDAVANTGGHFDFVVRGLPIAGSSVSIVIPQRSRIPEKPIYREFDRRWYAFVENPHDALASAPGIPGVCPPPGSAAYRPGLNPGDWCVQLTIADGGRNDSDRAVNGAIQVTGGVGTTMRPRNGGGGAFGWPSLMALLALAWWRRAATRPSRRSVGTRA